MTSELEKIAQRRSVFKRWVDPRHMGKRVQKNVSKTFSPEYREQYEALERADDEIREVFGPENLTIKELLKELKKEHKAHRYLAVLDRAARINQIVKEIVNNDEIKKIKRGREKAISDFYFSGTEDSKGDPISTEYIENLVNASEQKQEIIKEALFGDMGRRISDSFLSSFYDKDKQREAKRLINNIASQAETLARRMLDAYKKLDTARVRGDVGSYIDTISNLRKMQEGFESSFKSTYEKVSPLFPKKERDDETSPFLNEEDEKEGESREESVDNSGDQTDETVGDSVGEPPASGVDSDEPTFREADPNMMPPEDYESGESQQGAETQAQEPEFYPPPRPNPPPGASWTSEDITGKLPPPPKPSPPPGASWTQEDIVEVTAAIKRAWAAGDKGATAAAIMIYSDMLEDSGDVQGSLKAIAIAEGFIDD